MQIVAGVFVVLLSLALGVFALILTGLPWAATVAWRKSRLTILRHSLWWGLLLVSLVAIAINQFTRLGSAAAGLTLLAAIGVSGLIGGVALRRSPYSRSRPVTRSQWLLISAVTVFMVVLSLRILGPVTNYDTGLYHLGAIQYTEQFAAIPGLANIYFAYGYATAQFPLAAFLTWSPLGVEGYRALNSLIILIALIDLIVRFRQRDSSVGKYVMAAGLAVLTFTMLPLADYWVVSPTQDASVFTVTVVAGAYLSEALSRQKWVPAAATSVIISVVAVLLRPTMIAFALTLVIVVVVLAARRRATWSSQRLGTAVAVTALVSVAAMLLSAARDYMLSGWWQYPLSMFPFDVPWRAPDPTQARLATLGAARDPANLWEAAESWSWLSAWGSRAMSSWELYAFGALIIAAVVSVVLFRPPRMLIAAMAPSAVATVFWFTLTPPSFRFAWGPLFTAATIAVGWSLWSRTRSSRTMARDAALGVSLVLGLTVVATLAFRIDVTSISETRVARGIPITFAVTPITRTEVVEVTLPSGLNALRPADGDQCWAAFPVCSPQLPETLRLRGQGLQSGFLP